MKQEKGVVNMFHENNKLIGKDAKEKTNKEVFEL